MGIIKKTLFDEKLETLNVLVNDDDPTSKYFKLTELPDTFTGGKNAFLIQGSPELVADTIVKIQIKDAKGNTIYYEPGEGIPEYYEGTSKVISVYIYPDTAYGPCTITILGELKEYESNGIKTPIPENWKDTYNVKWEKQINVNPSLPNTTKIRFYRRPKVNVDELILNIYNREVVRRTISGSINGIAEIPAVGSDFKSYKGELTYKLQLNNSNNFSQSMVGETITINGSSINNGNSSYVTTIKEVLTQNTALATIPYFESSSTTPNYFPITNFVSQSYTTSFADTVTLTSSNISSSFAKIKITDLETFSGDANRVKVYASSKNSLGDFQLLEDIQLESNELLLEDEFGGDINVRTGIFTETVLSNFWVTQSIETGVVTSIDNELLLSSVKLQPITDTTSSVGLFKFYNSASLDFTQNTEYQLDFTPLLSSSLGYGKIEIYGSGSAFVNTDNSLKYGKLIGELETPTVFRSYDKQQINFKSDLDGVGNIVFLVKSGIWQISNVSLRAAQESAFSPNEVTLVANIPTRINNETFDFKVELYDINNNYVPVKIEKAFTFSGGNDTVTGIITAVTGAIEFDLTELSQSISGTIGELSGSVSGSISDVSGSVFEVSTSVSQLTASFSQSLSQSVSQSTAFAISQSSYTFNLATDELQKLADGQFSGSFIGDTTIYSPSIGGQNGYISNIFRVGQNGITLDGINKAIYVGNGVYNNINTPFYFASGSTNIFSLADKLSWDGTTLSVNGSINVTGGNAATQTYANTIGINSIQSASLDASTKSTNAIASASLDATTKASTAQQTAITVSAISASNAALSASAAFTNAKAVADSIANGTYTGGTLISSTSIISPVIAGANGYISNVFKVGSGGITLDGTNKAIYIGAGVYGNTNTGFYVDNNGSFSLKDKLTFDGTTLTVNGTVNVTGGNAATQTYANLIGINSIASASLDATTKANTAITVSAISASNAALSASAAFTNAKAVADSIANGTYTGGTLISSTSIISPVIAGANGYISNVFKVGSGGITLDGTNKAIYIGSGVYGNTNTGFYVDNNGNFSLKDKLTWNGTTLSVNGVVNASAGNFSGNITATSGKIGNWDISNEGSLQNLTGKLKINPTTPGIEIYDSSNAKRLDMHYGPLTYLGAVNISYTPPPITIPSLSLSGTIPNTTVYSSTSNSFYASNAGTYQAAITFPSLGTVGQISDGATSYFFIGIGIEVRDSLDTVISKNTTQFNDPVGGSGVQTIDLLANTTFLSINIPAIGSYTVYTYYEYYGFMDSGVTTSISITTWTPSSITLNLENNLVEMTNDGIQIATNAVQYLRLPRQSGGTIIDGTGEVYLYGNTSTNYTVSCQNMSTSGNALYIYANTNAIYVASGTVSKPGGGTWASISDRRVKKNEEQLTGSLDVIKQLKPKKFEYIHPEDKGNNSEGVQVGFIAQDIEEVWPAWVNDGTLASGSKDIEIVDSNYDSGINSEGVNIKTIGFGNDFFAMLVGSIQELSAKVEMLEAKLSGSI